jgi:drug/metabolite transporter (DMT)-like permease
MPFRGSLLPLREFALFLQVLFATIVAWVAFLTASRPRMDDPASCPRSARLPALVAGFATLYLVWGSTFLGIKFAIETLPPLLMAGGRFLLAGVILYLFLRVRGAPRPTPQEWSVAGLTGTLLLLGGNGLVTWGQQTVPSGRAALIVATTPLWMVLIGYFFYGGERPGLRLCLGLAVGFAGAILLIRPGGSDQAGDLASALALLASPLAWSIGSLESRRRPGSHGLLSSAMQMVAGGSLLVVAGSLLGEWPVLLARPVSGKSIGAFFYLSILGALVGFTTYAWLLRMAPPTAVSTYAYVNPLIAVLLGWLVAGESLDGGVLLPAGLIIGAVVLITLPRAATDSRVGGGAFSSARRGVSLPPRCQAAPQPEEISLDVSCRG